MGILEKIKEIEEEIGRTQKNKATEYHIGQLKARLAKLRTELLTGQKGQGGGGEGFEVGRTGDARVALIGFPSVGKSTLLTVLTGTESVAAAYEFTTLTCIPGNIVHKGTKIQVLDLPGIIEGAAQGKGRGRQVIAVAKSSDLVLMVLDAAKETEKNHRTILEAELESVGLRLNKTPPNIYFRKKKDGGIKFSSVVPLTKMGEDPYRTVYNILHEYKLHNAELLFREDCGADDLIDLIEGNRKYVRCLYVFNKADAVSMEDVDRLAREPHSLVMSATMRLNVPKLVDTMWTYLGLTRIHTKRRGQPPDIKEPVVLTHGRHGITVESLCDQIHKDMKKVFKYALVWGTSTKHSPMHCGLQHMLHDEDVVQIVSQSVTEQKASKDYSKRVQEYYDRYKKGKKKALKT